MEKCPLMHPSLQQGKSLSVMEHSGIRNSIPKVPAHTLQLSSKSKLFVVRHFVFSTFCSYCFVSSRHLHAYLQHMISLICRNQDIPMKAACSFRLQATYDSKIYSKSYSPSTTTPCLFCWNLFSIATPFFLSL